MVKVFFNNSCNICRAEINHYKKHSDKNVEWIDVNNNEEAQKITSKSYKELLRRMHVIQDGKVIDNPSIHAQAQSRVSMSNWHRAQLFEKSHCAHDMIVQPILCKTVLLTYIVYNLKNYVSCGQKIFRICPISNSSC